MKKKIIGFVIGIFSLSIISTASATEITEIGTLSNTIKDEII
jgi:hypothetical protein